MLELGCLPMVVPCGVGWGAGLRICVWGADCRSRLAYGEAGERRRAWRVVAYFRGETPLSMAC